MDGLQVTRQIREKELLRQPPAVVMITSFGQAREDAEKLDVAGFLVKPVTKSATVDVLVSRFASAEEKTVHADSGAEGPSVPLTGARILLAEDNEINQQIAVELLEGVGAKVAVANNGREAVEKLSAAPAGYDIVLMDLQMPEVDGYAATAKIRSDARFVAVPIIAMTAHATLEERQRCLAAGMNDHISKPIDPASMFETVARHWHPADESGPALSRDHKPLLNIPPNTAPALPSVEGLDAAAGLARVAGNRKLYEGLLRQFAEQQSDAAERAGEAIRAGDLATAERLAHTVKGVAGNLGAVGIQAAAAELEKAIREGGGSDRIEQLRTRLAAVLGPLVQQLRCLPGAAPDPIPATPVDPAKLRAVVEEMRGYLCGFDAAASDCFEANRDAFHALFSAAGFAEFEKKVQNFALDDALQQLTRAAEERSL
jgi:two-component system sensor histidine kinase/response regulator